MSTWTRPGRLALLLIAVAAVGVFAVSQFTVHAAPVPKQIQIQVDDPVPVPVVQVQIPGQPAPDLQKQIDDALKELDKLEKIAPEKPENVKKQIEDVRQKMRKQLLDSLNQPGFPGLPPGIIVGPGGGFGGIGVAPAWGGIGPAIAPGGGHGRLGVVLQRPLPVVVDQLKLPANQGLVVLNVQPESAAAKAGIQKHDILLEVNGKAVSSDLPTFQKDLREIKADAEVTASVLRKGQKETIKGIKLPEAKAEPAVQPLPFGLPPGIQIQPGGAGGAGFGGGAGGPVPGLPGAGGIGGIGGIGQIQIQAIAGGNGDSTAISITNDEFTIKHSSGNLKVGIKGKRDNGKLAPSEITVDEGDTMVRAQNVEQVPERFRATVNKLLESVK